MRKVAMTLVALAVALPAMAQQKKVDQDFDSGLGNFTVTSKRISPAGGVSDKVLHNGKKTAELIGNASSDVVTSLELSKPAIRLLAGQQYTASIFVKTDSVAGGVKLNITMPDGVKIDGLKDEKLTGTGDWKEFKQTFTVSQDSQPLSIALELTGPGKVWADDFKLAGKVGMEWTKRIALDPTDVAGGLKANGLDTNAYVNYHTGRWPYISFIGGMAMGNDSKELEFFYTDPGWKWSWRVLDYALTDGGKVFGLRAKVHRYKEEAAGQVKPMQSFLLTIRTDAIWAEYYPSYIYANGRKVWDYNKDKKPSGGNSSIVVPFSVENGEDIVVDMVVDKDATPASKGLALRMFFVTYITEDKNLKTGQQGLKVDLTDAEEKVTTGSPADKLDKFQFGLFPSKYDFWGDSGRAFADIKKTWKPNFKPAYATDNVYRFPYIMEAAATPGKYYEFLLTYGGCNTLGTGSTSADVKKYPDVDGVTYSAKSADAVKKILEENPNIQATWWKSGEANSSPADKVAYEQARAASGAPARFKTAVEPFSPSLSGFTSYDNGVDYLIYKNEEDPSYNIMMSMGRGIARTYGKPFGFYWEQTHYPYPSLDEKLNCCMLYYLSGGSWIGAEADEAPAFAKEIVADWTYPYVQAMRFAMVHPARGTNIVPVGVVYSKGDGWVIPYNPFGMMDTFQRYVEYDNKDKKLICEPAFTKFFDWMPTDPKQRENWRLTGHVNGFINKLDELRGYDLLDVFFPKFGDAYTAHIGRLLTGTPYGPVDFVVLEEASKTDYLKSFGVLAFMGKATVRGDAETKVAEAAASGSQVIIGVQHFSISQNNINGKPFGLTFDKGAAAEGAVTGLKEIVGDKGGTFNGTVYGAKGDGWETVASVGEKPLIIRKAFGKGAIYVYLGRWVHQGEDALRQVLAFAGRQAAPLVFDKPDDQMEYVAYKKNEGAWVALFNHGGIYVGCDTLDPKSWRVQPPEPLFTAPRGPYSGTIEFRLDKLGLDPKGDYALYEVVGIDDKALEGVISGQKSFEVKDAPFDLKDGVIKASVKLDKRAEYVIAPKGKGKEVFFGK